MSEFKLIFPGAKGGIRLSETGTAWTWWAAYADGSGIEIGWRPTERGAKQCATAMGRRITRDYTSKSKWVPVC